MKILNYLPVISIISLAIGADAKVIDIDQQLIVKGLTKIKQTDVTSITQQSLENARSGDVVLLSRMFSTGTIFLDSRNSGVDLNWGKDGRIVVSGTINDLKLNNISMDLLGKTGTHAFLQNATIINLNGAVTGINADGVLTVVHQIQGTPWSVQGQWTNCTTLWFRILAENVGRTMVSFANVDATNSKIYGIIETDYGNTLPTIAMSSTKGLTMGGGDTERSGSQTGVYTFTNCSDMNFVATRTYWTHTDKYSYTTNGWLLAKSSNINWIVSNDIGDNISWSLRALECPGLKIWGGFFADSVFMDASTINDPNHLKFFYIPLGFGSKPIHQWGGPADILTDTVIDYRGKTIDRSTPLETPPDFTQIELPRVPRLPVIKHSNLRAFGSSLGKKSISQAVSASWGAEALSAGADPTGKKSSSAVIQKLIQEKGFVELPKGNLLFSKSVVLPSRVDIKKVTIAGAGSQFTTIRTTGNFPAFIDEDPTPILKKSGKGMKDLAEFHFYGIAYDGGGTADWGQKYGTHSSTQHNDEVYQNYRVGGVAIGDYTKVNDPTYIVRNDGNDQVRWINCKFINCGDYGIYCNREMTDKQLFHNCLFENLNKAGLSYTRTHMFEASTITNCTFRNINGPGVKFGGNVITGLGKGPGPFTMQNCLFEECGNATEAACELSNSESAAHINNRIVIKNKPWKYGMAASGQFIQRLTIDVDTTKMVAGGAALALRHAHQWGNNRVAASFVSLVQSQGPLKFINDCAEFQAYYGDAVAMPSSFARYAWDYCHVFDSCSFKNGAMFLDYLMVNTSENGSIENQIAFKGMKVDVSNFSPDKKTKPGFLTNFKNQTSQPEKLFDLQGRMLSKRSGINNSTNRLQHRYSGIIVKSTGSKVSSVHINLD